MHPRAANPPLRLHMGIGKNTFHRNTKFGCDPKGEVERRGVPLGFERIDRIARHADRDAQLLLRPIAFGAQHFDPAFHGVDPRTKGVTTPSIPQNSG